MPYTINWKEGVQPLTPEQERDNEESWNLLIKKYGMWDYTKYMYGIKGVNDPDTGYYRYAAYHDGGWLEGYYLQPVIYWGA